MSIDQELREGVIALAQAAAVRIMAVYGGDFDVTRKADASPLTDADLASHACIVDGLERLTPDIPVLSEESAEDVPSELRRQWPTLWLVDPLDGTREFVKRNGEFTVNIALIVDGVAVFGVIQQPTTGLLWHGTLEELTLQADTLQQAAMHRGAFRREGDRDIAIQCSSPAPKPLRVAASRSHRDARTDAFLARLGDTTPLAQGSSLKFCRIAQGDMDVYPRFGPTSEWDTAAGQAIVEAAGGLVVDPRGRPLRYNQRDTLLNGDFLALGDPGLPWREWL